MTDQKRPRGRPKAPKPSPPWRWVIFARVTGDGPEDAARDALLDAMIAADVADSPADVAVALGVTLRTLYRARAWLREHAPELAARLRPRADAVALAQATQRGAKPRGDR